MKIYNAIVASLGGLCRDCQMVLSVAARLSVRIEVGEPVAEPAVDDPEVTGYFNALGRLGFHERLPVADQVDATEIAADRHGPVGGAGHVEEAIRLGMPEKRFDLGRARFVTDQATAVTAVGAHDPEFRGQFPADAVEVGHVLPIRREAHEGLEQFLLTAPFAQDACGTIGQVDLDDLVVMIERDRLAGGRDPGTDRVVRRWTR